MKLDTGILNSTLWVDRDGREVFITALLMAEPYEITEPMAQIEVRTMTPTGWAVPPGWYGRVPAAGVGICRQAGVDREVGLNALERLGAPEPDSRSHEHEGRRLVRVDGGYIVLNYFRYRDRDYGAADRMRRLRARRKSDAERYANSDESSRTPSPDRHVPPKVTHSREQSTESRVQNDNNDPTTTARARPANPLVDRDKLVKEGYQHIGVIVLHEKLDPTEVLMKASKYRGHTSTALDAQGDDYLAHTVGALRTWARRVTGKSEPEMPVATEKTYVSPKAEAFRRGIEAGIRGGLRDERKLGEGVGNAGALPAGPGDGRDDEGGPRRRLPSAPKPPHR